MTPIERKIAALVALATRAGDDGTDAGAHESVAAANRARVLAAKHGLPDPFLRPVAAPAPEPPSSGERISLTEAQLHALEIAADLADALETPTLGLDLLWDAAEVSGATWNALIRKGLVESREHVLPTVKGHDVLALFQAQAQADEDAKERKRRHA